MSIRPTVQIESSDEEMVSSDASSDGDYRPSGGRHAAKRARPAGLTDSQSQSQSSQPSLTPTELTPAEVVRLAGLVANYFLAAECKKVSGCLFATESYLLTYLLNPVSVFFSLHQRLDG